MGDRLDLVREELRELATPLVEESAAPAEPFGVYVIPADSPRAELARAVERTVFEETFGNPGELLDAEYGPFEASTVFYCVIDHRRRLPAGSMRMILPSERGLKTFQAMEVAWAADVDAALADTGVVWDPARTWDVTTLAVAPDYRGKATDGLISLALYQTLIRSALAGDAQWLVTVLDLKPLELIQTLTIDCFQHFRGLGPISYLDSPLSVPVFIDLVEWEPRVLEHAPDTHGILFRGVGIEAAVRPPDWEPLVEVLGRRVSVPSLVTR
jgi:hypothetical protein